MSKSPLSNIAGFLRTPCLGRSVAALVCVTYSSAALANDASGYALIAIGIVCCLVVVASIVAFVACKRIRDHTLRALTRLAIVVLVCTPVPMPQGAGRTAFVPAFFAAIPDFLGTGARGHGLFAHPHLLAYGIAFLLFVPLVLAWLALENRYGHR